MAEAKSRYEIKEVIAKGGMGIVYRAHDTVMNRPVALKTLLALSDANAIRLFERECQDLASLIHPNIVEIFDVGQIRDNGEVKPYLVMPLLPGVTLDKLINNSSQRLTVERSIDIICQTCRGLQAAHDRGIVHRDLKPSNLFVMSDDSVKIIDFGVAGRMDRSRTMGLKGTLLYMSPEQLEMKAVSAVSDVFSLAVVCYETLTRRRPFERATEKEVVEAILTHVPPPASEFNPAVSPLLSQVIHKAMAKQSWSRFQSAREFAENLQKALRNEPIEILNPVRIRPRLQRAREAYEKGDLVFALEIISELESEGHLDASISDLKRLVEAAATDRKIQQLLESARIRLEEKEYQLALQKVQAIIEIDPTHTEALALKSRIEARRTEADIEEWLRVARQHLDKHGYAHAREALQRIVQLRPREPRALQLLAEVDRREQDYVRIRTEKEQLYYAAVDAERKGDISAALSNAVRVIELDQRAPELLTPDRGLEYQNFYNKVRSEHDAIQRAFEEAQAHLANGNFSAALAICNEQLSKYPGHALFQGLKYDIEDKRRRALFVRIVEIDQSVDAEPDLNRCVSILEEAAREYPDEPRFERSLQLVRNKRDLVEAIVARARALEDRGLFGEALTQWEQVQLIHARYPGVNLELDRVRKRKQQQERIEAKRRWAEQVERCIETKDYLRARDLLRSAAEDFPGDAELAELEKLAVRGQERADHARKLLEEGVRECGGGNFDQGIALLGQAYELDDQNLAARSALLEALVQRARDTVDSHPATAEKLAREALDLEPNDALARGVIDMIEDQRRAAYIEQCVSQALQLQNAGDLRKALEVVEEGLKRHPNEGRFLQIRANLGKALSDERRRDLDEARRIEREAASGADQPAVRDYSRRLDTFATRYRDDQEFQTVLMSARTRLESLFRPVDVTAPVVSSPGGAAAAVKPALSGAPAAEPEQPAASSGAPSQGRAVIEQARAAAVRAGDTVRAVWSQPKRRWAALGCIVVFAVSGIIIRIARHHERPQPPAVVVKHEPPPPAPVPTPAPKPEMQRLTIIGSGSLVLDGGPAEEISDVLEREFPAGEEHRVRVSLGRGAEVSFRFGPQTGKPAVVTDLQARDMLAFIVSTSAYEARIYSNRRLGKVKIDGNPAGELGPDGLSFTGHAEAKHEIQWTEGEDVKKRAVDIEKTRALAVYLESDPNVGSLLVNAVDGAEVIVLNSKGKEVRRGTVANGKLILKPIRAGKYSIKVAREGYEPAVRDGVTISKGDELPLTLNLKRIPVAASVRIMTEPAAEVFVDGTLLGKAGADGGIIAADLKAGAHRFSVRAPGFKAKEITASLEEGNRNSDINLKLDRASATVKIMTDPPDAKVTYTASADHNITGEVKGAVSLPPGEYIFRATAKNFRDWVKLLTLESGEVTLKVEMVAEIPQPQPVQPCAGLATGKPSGDGCVLTNGSHQFSKRIAAGVIEFTASTDDKAIRWQAAYKDDRNYWEFQLENKSLKCVYVENGRSSQKCDEKLSLSKGEPRTIHMKIAANQMELAIAGTPVHVTLTEPGADLSGVFRFKVGKKPLTIRRLSVKP